MSSDLVVKACQFARAAHKGQERKYTGEPYFNHVYEVAMLVESVPHTQEMIAAAYLHDVVEDTKFTLHDIFDRFGGEVHDLVLWLTDVSTPAAGNRAQRKALDRNHIAQAPAEAQTIKLADLISNTETIVQYDPDFAKVYLKEKQQLLDVLTRGDATLLQRARDQVSAARDAIA